MINEGDLVYVAAPTACGCYDRMGMVFRVTMMRPASEQLCCVTCGSEYRSTPGEMVAEGLGEYSVNVRRLKKLDGNPEVEKGREVAA